MTDRLLPRQDILRILTRLFSPRLGRRVGSV